MAIEGAGLEVVSQAAGWLLRGLAGLFLSPGSNASLWSLATAGCVAALILLARRPPGKKPVRLKVLLRTLFPRWILRHRSSRADLALLAFNGLIYGAIFGGATLSAAAVATVAGAGLTSLLGAHAPALPPPVGVGLLTLAVFLAAELAYWVDHWLKHRIPALWAFHKVHHTAEVLTPATAFRVHPVDTLVFANITALFIGLTEGLGRWLLGQPIDPLAVAGHNLIIVAFVFAVGHLQHSHLWIAFPGWWGRLFLSPAAHQLHHSADPRHFGSNFGSFLAVWDWMFGTLRAPTAQRERLTFGVEPRRPEQHGLTGVMLTPFVEAARLDAIPQGEPRLT
ncbi:sterol desaturase/sphingolipid hydroxylase (fatty acid hydroxylase superfamily) [Caulobacter ginsengisoli]|uniref:Sterol desaturase/sphingolipid hydroxylase (Fatty acid hydroxylase superfamily) n=1 Tax=Caulobacter ginsengisoli TaxID=400775 RepID=A0ABU0IMV9_9CAUL|nr:sterol desaturase family protein [Caulobacter ginsengisoli]MDQ0463325.1 sterol desaturase/sphingolipid hydroxylase (fatty acid hydroxylase superfamily) [Caulobacter ginsengisoli]